MGRTHLNDGVKIVCGRSIEKFPSVTIYLLSRVDCKECIGHIESELKEGRKQGDE